MKEEAIKNKDLLIHYSQNSIPLYCEMHHSHKVERGSNKATQLPSGSCGKEKEGQVVTLAKVFVKYPETAELLCSCPN